MNKAVNQKLLIELNSVFLKIKSETSCCDDVYSRPHGAVMIDDVLI